MNGQEDEVKIRCEQIWFDLLLFSNNWTSYQGYLEKKKQQLKTKIIKHTRVAKQHLYEIKKYHTPWYKIQMKKVYSIKLCVILTSNYILTKIDKFTF